MSYDTEGELEEMEAAHDLDMDDYDAGLMEAIECCPHCGKPFEEFSDLGCPHCDRRVT